jgi:NAD(P)-dependent dehydrogenase (short-subunit alcohol dehydrogenase family)
MPETPRQKTRIALVTGAGRERGIGYETASQLSGQGITVILSARDDAAAKARAKTLAARGLDVVAMRLDVTDEASIKTLAEEIERGFGRLDILINNAAGTAPYGELAASADLAVARQVIDTTLFGAWRLTQALLPLLKKSAHPRIVNVSSGAGSHADKAFGLMTGNAMGTSYAVAKAALNALTAKFAKEETGILVNAICPGFTATFDGGEAMGARPVKDGAAGIVWAATLPDDGPTGGFFRDAQPLGW